MRSIPEKIVFVSLSKFKSSPFSLINTKENGSEDDTIIKKYEFETLTKKLVKFLLIRLNIPG
jgi:hypothetical protein